jgi:hypothetical protein
VAHLEIGCRSKFERSASEALAQSEACLIPLDSQFDLDDHPVEWLGAIVDVGDWLRTLGLGQCETAFREGEIDAEVLPELTGEQFPCNRNEMNSEPFREYECSTRLAPQPAFARPAILQSQAAYAGAGTDSLPT